MRALLELSAHALRAHGDSALKLLDASTDTATSSIAQIQYLLGHVKKCETKSFLQDRKHMHTHLHTMVDSEEEEEDDISTIISTALIPICEF
jgi:hypothetical protein